MKKQIVAALARMAQFEWNPQTKLWNRTSIGGTSLGAAGAMAALGKLFGISAVAHSSGAMILTGTSGYIAGTLVVGTLVWIILPLLVVLGLCSIFWKQIASAFKWTGIRLCGWRKSK